MHSTILSSSISFWTLLLFSSSILLAVVVKAGQDNQYCVTFNTCNELRDALLNSNDGKVDVCGSPTNHIVCDETMDRIWLNDASNPQFKLNCISPETCGRCIIDYTPTQNYDGISSYGGFVLQKQNELIVDGFEFINYQGVGDPIFYNQEGSTLTIRNSVFEQNMYTGTEGKIPILVYDYSRGSPNLCKTTIENSLFQGNAGTLLGFQAGNAILKNNIFHDNGLPEGYEFLFQYTSFISWKPVSGAQFIVEGNHFHSFTASEESGTHNKFFILSATDNSWNTTALFSGVGSDNCAASNNVAGDYDLFGIEHCNDGVFGKGTWPDVQCMQFVGEACTEYPEETGPPKPCATRSDTSDSIRKYFFFDDDKKALDIVPSDSNISPLIDQTVAFTTPTTMTIFSGTDGRTHYGDYNLYQSVDPSFHPEGSTSCAPPTYDPDQTWPGKGCTCFVPGFPEVSYMDMDDPVDVTNTASGYRTAFDTSVTGGITVAGWFKAGDTSSDPWNAHENHPGQQTSLIFVRGMKASWKSGYNFGLGNWNSWRFEVILRGPNDDRYALGVSSEVNAYPGIDVWHYVVGVYDAELGRASLYVDNQLVAWRAVPFNWERWEKDIQWRGSDYELSKTRIGNGYDANDKNFHGCTGGFAVYGEAVTVSDSEYEPPEDLSDYGCGRRLSEERNNNRLLQSQTCTALPNSGVVYESAMEQKWGMSIPSFGYESLAFSLCYGVSDYINDTMVDYTIYKRDCVTPASSGALTANQWVHGASYDALGGTGDRTVEMNITINAELIVQSNLYSESANGGTAFVDFCVRDQLWTRDRSYEVNFLETLVQLQVDLRDCFDVDSINVEQKNNTEKTAEDAFTVEGYFCDENKIASPMTGPLNQGTAVRVCVRPTQKGRDNGIFMRNIFNFTWTNGVVEQAAIIGPNQVARNGLTDIDCASGYAVCSFETILMAPFFSGTFGYIFGSGTANLQLGSQTISRRRDLRRRLQILDGLEELDDDRQNDGEASTTFELSFETMPAFHYSSGETNRRCLWGTTGGLLVVIAASIFFL